MGPDPAAMIPLLLLLAAAPLERATLFEGEVSIPRSQWRAIRLDLNQRPATIEVSHESVRGRSAVRVVLMTSADVERFSQGRSHRVLASSPFSSRGNFRYAVTRPGHYQVLFDNRLEGRGPAVVKVKVDVVFDNRLSFTPRELPEADRHRVVFWSLSGLLLVCAACGWPLLTAVRARRTPPPDPPFA